MGKSKSGMEPKRRRNMRHLQTYKIFEAGKTIGLNTKQVAFLNKYVKAKPGRSEWLVDYSTDPPTVNVFTDVSTSQSDRNKKIKSLQGINFGEIRGDFRLHDIDISSFEGFPKKVGGSVILGHSAKLKTSFREFPNIKIGGSFILELQELGFLDGCPEEVGNLYVYNTRILDMQGCPKKYTSDGGILITLNGNNRLISLEGIPAEIDSSKIDIKDYPDMVVPVETLIGGFEGFQKTGTWIPYYLELAGISFTNFTEVMKNYIKDKITPEAIQEFINLDSAKAAVALKGKWTEMKKNPKFSGLKFPSHSTEADLLADLSDVGL